MFCICDHTFNPSHRHLLPSPPHVTLKDRSAVVFTVLFDSPAGPLDHRDTPLPVVPPSTADGADTVPGVAFSKLSRRIKSQTLSLGCFFPPAELSGAEVANVGHWH